MFFAAQRYGLVDAPPQLLTEDEWKKVKEKANRRQDFQQPCVICKEELGFQQHVSLGCLLSVMISQLGMGVDHGGMRGTSPPRICSRGR